MSLGPLHHNKYTELPNNNSAAVFWINLTTYLAVLSEEEDSSKLLWLG